MTDVVAYIEMVLMQLEDKDLKVELLDITTVGQMAWNTYSITEEIGDKRRCVFLSIVTNDTETGTQQPSASSSPAPAC